MPSLPHDALIELFRQRPSLAPELLRSSLNTRIPDFESVRVSEADLTALAPTEFRADMVLLLVPPGGGDACGALVVEVQRRADKRKHWAWPAYLAVLRSRLRCDVSLLVVTDKAAVARWAATPIPTGHPGWVLTPLVLGPDNVPFVSTAAEAALSPELAVLSVIVHVRHPDIVTLATAALAGARSLDADRAALYSDVVFAAVQRISPLALEALMTTHKYEFQSDFAKHHFALGEARGEARGKAEGEARSVLTVLSARGIAVTDDLQARILACSDLDQLDRWLTRAVTAASAAEVVGD
jgi:hypothetical protein